MKAMRLVALAFVAACGSPPPPPVRVAPVKPRPAPVPAAVTCGEAGVILRGSVKDTVYAAPDKEAVIARACFRGKWSATILDCVGTSKTPRMCLDRLEPAQHTLYIKLLSDWSGVYPDEEVAELDKHGGDDDEIEIEEDIGCEAAVEQVEHVSPRLQQQGADRKFAVELRKQLVLPACDVWPNSARKCFADAAPNAVDACRKELDPTADSTLATKISEGDALLAKIAALPSKKAECAAVAAFYYSDAAWRASGPPLTGSVRTKAISESRATMTKSCKADTWSLALRACIALGAGVRCFEAEQRSTLMWGFPAGGVVVKTNIRECDAYGTTLRKLAACDKLPKRSMESLLATFARQAADYAVAPANEKKVAAALCKQSDDAIKQAATQLGCTI